MISEANYQELKKYLEPYHPSKEEYARFVELKRQKLIKIKTWNPASVPGHEAVPVQDTFVITEAGKDALSKFEQELNKEAEHKRQQRFQNKISVASVLVPLITFFLGLIVEHFVPIVGWFFSLFK